jgi:hypothetical protein
MDRLVSYPKKNTMILMSRRLPKAVGPIDKKRIGGDMVSLLRSSSKLLERSNY